MSSSIPTRIPATELLPPPAEKGETGKQLYKPLVSVIVPAYNEAAIVEHHLDLLCKYMQSLEAEYRWEVIFINDGSTDGTGDLAEAFARSRDNIRVYHHITNFGLGQALKFAFSRCRGDYLVTLDLDLSYSPEHIRALLSKIRETKAKIVIASPYMKGGKISSIPWHRRFLSIWANRFLSIAAKGTLSTITGMVRAYDATFVRALDLKSIDMAINPETIYKATLLSARIEEIPAHLNWQVVQKADGRRRSSMRILRHTMSVLLSGFLFRPFMFFVLPGLALLLFSLYVNTWMFIHFFARYQSFTQYTWFLSRASVAVAAAYQDAPHTFLVGITSLMLAIQLISLGILALQSKRYFEEIFHLGTTIYRFTRANGRSQS